MAKWVIFLLFCILATSIKANRDDDRDKHKGKQKRHPPPEEPPPVEEPPPLTYASPPPVSRFYYYSPPPPPPRPCPPPPPPPCYPPPPPSCPYPAPYTQSDAALLNRLLTLQYLVDSVYTQGLSLRPDGRSPLFRQLLAQFSRASASYIRESSSLLGSAALKKPKVDVSSKVFANIMNSAFGSPLKPQFQPYANFTNFLIAAYAVGPSLVASSSMDAISRLHTPESRTLGARILAAYSRQDATIRFIVQQKEDEIVAPYRRPVKDFAAKLCRLVAGGNGECGSAAEAPVPKKISLGNVTAFVTRFSLLP